MTYKERLELRQKWIELARETLHKIYRKEG